MIEPPGIKNQMATISLAVVLSAAVATVALRAAARRQGSRSLPGAEDAPVTVTVGESQPRSAVTPGTQDGAGRDVGGSDRERVVRFDLPVRRYVPIRKPSQTRVPFG